MRKQTRHSHGNPLHQRLLNATEVDADLTQGLSFFVLWGIDLCISSMTFIARPGQRFGLPASHLLHKGPSFEVLGLSRRRSMHRSQRLSWTYHHKHR